MYRFSLILLRRRRRNHDLNDRMRDVHKALRAWRQR